MAEKWLYWDHGRKTERNTSVQYNTPTVKAFRCQDDRFYRCRPLETRGTSQGLQVLAFIQPTILNIKAKGIIRQVIKQIRNLLRL
jgi:hypothetical protein